MPGGFPGNYSICNAQSVGAVTTVSAGTTVTASGSTNTKGTYTSLITATAYSCCYAMIEIVVSAATLGLVDISIGTGGNQRDIIPNIFCGAAVGATGERTSLVIALPISIPAGTNIWSRAQSATASTVYTVNMQLFSGSFTAMPGVAGYDDLGTSLAASTGTLITPSVSSNTLGTWTSIIASTTKPYMGIWGIVGFGTANINYLTNFGVGPSSPANVIIPNYASRNLSAAGVASTGTLPFLPIQLPMGTQLWAQNQANGATESGQSITLYGAYK